MKRSFIVVMFLFFFHEALLSQDSVSVSLNGYLTTMQSSMFDSLSGPFINENLLHNRLNFKAYIGSNITLSAEIRNRLFTGDLVKQGKAYAEIIGADNGWLDMSWNVIEKPSFLFNTTADRLWADLRLGKFQATAGRQRINWGQALVWNPNDIFNTYSFFDIDYPERPGSDAVRFQYFPSSSSAVEFAAKAGHDKKVTAAGLYRFNRRGYDIQFLAGISEEKDIVIGTGWSGAIKSFSFRGEASWFAPYKDFSFDESTVLATAGFDKIFSDNSMAQVQVMYCNNPPDPDNFDAFYSGSLTSKDQAFSKFSAFGEFTWATTPLLNISVPVMWFPDLDGYFAGLSMDYSLAENLDFSLIWQHFNARIAGARKNMNMGFLRLKYSF